LVWELGKRRSQKILYEPQRAPRCTEKRKLKSYPQMDADKRTEKRGFASANELPILFGYIFNYQNVEDFRITEFKW
jgi:hypothetical protein